jgi:hypothetical protein
MRTYGRIFILNPDGTRQKPQPAGYPKWVTIQTDPNTGSNAWVYLTTLCQTFLLNLGEAPFDASSGLPAQQSVIQQIAPDFYVNRIQQQFAQYFASLIVAKDPTQAVPTYNITATMFDGTPASATIQVPE